MKESPHHEKKAGISEWELIEAFERVVREDYPNPERIGCPGLDVLKLVADSSARAPQSVLDHLAKCAPCLEEYDRLRGRTKALLPTI